MSVTFWESSLPHWSLLRCWTFRRREAATFQEWAFQFLHHPFLREYSWWIYQVWSVTLVLLMDVPSVVSDSGTIDGYTKCGQWLWYYWWMYQVWPVTLVLLMDVPIALIIRVSSKALFEIQPILSPFLHNFRTRHMVSFNLFSRCSFVQSSLGSAQV